MSFDFLFSPENLNCIRKSIKVESNLAVLIYCILLTLQLDTYTMILIHCIKLLGTFCIIKRSFSQF